MVVLSLQELGSAELSVSNTNQGIKSQSAVLSCACCNTVLVLTSIMCPSCLYSHYSTADFSEVMGRHMIADAETVSGDLTYFSNKFIESGFITQTAASNVLSKLGVSNGDKSREIILGLVRQNYNISLKKLVWANKFIGIFIILL